MCGSFLKNISMRWSRRLRFTVSALMAGVVPTVYILALGPFVKETFEWWYRVTPNLSDHLHRTVQAVTASSKVIDKVFDLLTTNFASAVCSILNIYHNA